MRRFYKDFKNSCFLTENSLYNFHKFNEACKFRIVFSINESLELYNIRAFVILPVDQSLPFCQNEWAFDEIVKLITYIWGLTDLTLPIRYFNVVPASYFGWELIISSPEFYHRSDQGSIQDT